MPLTDLATVKALFAPSMDTARDAALSTCILQASAWVQEASGLILEKPSSARTEILTGSAARGKDRCVLYLDQRRPFVLHSGSDLITVTEDGISMTLATGFSTTADVLLENTEDLSRPCRLIRRNQAWSSAEPRNVAATYKHGYDLSGMPAFIVGLATEAAWLIWQSQDIVGKQSVAVQGQSVSFEKNLTPISASALARLRAIANV